MKRIYFDIETIPEQTTGAIDRYLAEVHPPAQYKKPESIQKWIDQNAERVAVENWKKSALEGLRGEIVSIAWAFDDRPVEGICRAPNEPEADTIKSFYSAISREIRAGEGKYPKFQWVGHNIIEFDLRFLYQRSVILGIQPPIVLPIDERHGNRKVFDTMKGWEGWRGYVKQDALIEALGIDLEVPERLQAMDGSQVWDLVQSGQFDLLLEYNCLDVERSRNSLGG